MEMTVTAKDLRFNISMLFDLLSKGEDITVTYRGKAKAKLIAFEDVPHNKKINNAFGMLKDENENVDGILRKMRKGRSFDI